MATQFSRVPSEAPRSTDLESESIPTMLRRLTDELVTLFRQEMALARAEISRSVTSFIAGAASLATGGVVLFAGFLVLLAAAVLGLATVMRPWLAALIVGVVAGIIGYLMVRAGRKALDPDRLKPARTAQSLRRDKDVLARKES